jgi:acyl carrier protein
MTVRRDQVEKILRDLAGPEAELSDDARLMDDLGLDSLDAIEVVMALEELAKRSISDSELEALTTVGDVMRLAGCAS